MFPEASLSLSLVLCVYVQRHLALPFIHSLVVLLVADMDMEEAKRKEVAQGTAFGAVSYQFAYNNPTFSNFTLRIATFASLNGVTTPPRLVLEPVHAPHQLEGEKLQEAQEQEEEEDSHEELQAPEKEEEEQSNERSADEEKRERKSSTKEHQLSTPASVPSSNASSADREAHHFLSAGDKSIAITRTDESRKDPNTVQQQTAIGEICTLHVDSTLLSAHSAFFIKFFSIALGKSRQRKASLYVTASEKHAVMDLLRYMYSGSIRANSQTEVQNVLIVAEKFGALFCVQYCVRLLESLPATLEWALTWMQMPIAMILQAAAQPLTKRAKSIILNQFKDLRLEATLALPLDGVKFLLASDQVVVDSEDDVFDFVIAWAENKYHDINERNKVLADSLLPLVRFSMMTTRKLQRLLDGKVCLGTPAFLPRAIAGAFAFKLEPVHRKAHIAKEIQNQSYVKRLYKRLPVKLVEFEASNLTIVYFNITWEDCAPLASLESVQGVQSEGFDLHWGVCHVIYKHVQDSLQIDIGLESSNSLPCSVFCRLSARSSADGGRYVQVHSVTNMYTKIDTGLSEPYMGTWSGFLCSDNTFFIDRTQYLQVEISKTS